MLPCVCMSGRRLTAGNEQTVKQLAMATLAQDFLAKYK